MPVPCGCFVPIFKTGGAFGRLIGEYMALSYPFIKKIVPGGYAIAGAAAFSGAVTQSVSTSLVAFELSGELAHLIPTLVTTIIANAVASLFAPSMYDSVILLKKLPFLPDLLPSNSGRILEGLNQMILHYNNFLQPCTASTQRILWYAMLNLFTTR